MCVHMCCSECTHNYYYNDAYLLNKTVKKKEDLRWLMHICMMCLREYLCVNLKINFYWMVDEWVWFG